MKFEIFKFKTVTSTNDVALNLIREKKKQSGFVYSEIQTKGRGTHGKKWISLKGNLFASVFFPMKEHYPGFDEFSIINPIIISEVLKNFCKGKNITLKFPNDVFVNKKKICGILQEIITFKEINFLIIGIGMNVLSSPIIKNQYEATNIFSETNMRTSIKELINEIIFSYERFFINIKSYNYKNFKKKAESMAFN